MELIIEFNVNILYEGKEEITYNWLKLLNSKLSTRSISKGIDLRRRSEIDNHMRKLWDRLLELKRPLSLSTDNVEGSEWLRSNHPDEGSGESAKLFHGPQNKILLLNCKTENLRSYLVPQHFVFYLL